MLHIFKLRIYKIRYVNANAFCYIGERVQHGDISIVCQSDVTLKIFHSACFALYANFKMHQDRKIVNIAILHYRSTI